MTPQDPARYLAALVDDDAPPATTWPPHIVAAITLDGDQ